MDRREYGAETTKITGGSSAIFEGDVEPGDRTWGLEANVTVDGQNYYSSTGGLTGTSVYTGQRITCSDWNCGASHEFSNCPAKNYVAYGAVFIYNNWDSKSDTKQGFMRLTNCDTSNDGHCDLSDNGGSWQDTDTTEPGGCCYTLCSPILINLGGNGFHLTGTEWPVRFDIDADGDMDAISWTAADADEAFLALDRNHNGFIDDGNELFGAATAQPLSLDPNGFIALSVFDDPASGGNGDGMISALDQVFPDLMLWTDSNRNGASEPWELSPLLDREVVSIRLDYRLTERKDRYGNRFPGGAPHIATTVDR